MDIQYSPKYRELFAEHIPRFMVLEIEPIMKRLGHAPARPLCVFDVGANVGGWTMALLSHSGPWIGEVHMFEPLPANRARLDEARRDGLFRGNARLAVQPCALSHAAGTARIHFEAEESRLASIDNSAAMMPMRDIPLGRSLEIETRTLDDYCAGQKIERIDILKIDVEGHEMSVLRGAERMFREKRIGIVAYELGPHQIERREFFRDFFRFFEGHGYQNHRYRENGWSTMPIKAYRPGFETFDQVVMRMAVHPDYADA
ncbi:MAG: FkbM family methyltransferase [Rhodobacteraceae bacterium]|nr:FkbM family methyltransferase [Paracoccaceae bacterium]